ncbi:DMT family transporter [Methylobacterium dankookense]|uniref:Multidrug transporter EmrE n=1 Tax=Methylobacterium dankookense TaxID=560405 RepID=A0A564FXC1_9HYPH|nr:multidrug efflux SMR transporter [Methylobacterium dankookense]GJD55631.1 Multidrug transporter EmrE [Methylobacterium dankookense]VUF12815.1 Multidrug transporter EmrE [Methylobacterium dankookense]
MSSQPVAYAALAVAILCEIAGTTFLAKSEQFTKVAPTLAMAAFYAGAFYFLTHALKAMPLGVAYAIWSGVGVVLTALIGAMVFKQSLDLPAIAGIAMIVGGVVVMQAFSTTAGH